MAAQDHLSQQEFAQHKARANRTAKSIKVKGEWINPDKGVIQKKQQATRDWHDSLRPMKATIKNSGATFSQVINHVHNNIQSLSGKKMNKESSHKWARDTHDSDPENFMTNIRFPQ